MKWKQHGAPEKHHNKHSALWRLLGNWYLVEILPLPAWCNIPVAFSTRTPGTEIWGCQRCVNKHLLPNYCAQLAVISSGGVHPAPIQPSLRTMVLKGNYANWRRGENKTLVLSRFSLYSYKNKIARSVGTMVVSLKQATLPTEPASIALASW